MNQKEILNKMARINKEVEKNQLNIIKEKILERNFHLQKSKRNVFMRKILEKIRKRLISEISHILHPTLENQKEINLILLKEIERLKDAHALRDGSSLKNKNEKESTKSRQEDQK